MNTNFISASIFSPSQLGAIIALAVILFLLLVFNGVLFFIFKKQGARKLCTKQLQNKRDALLDRLTQIKISGFDDSEYVEEAKAEQMPEISEEDDDTDSDEDDDDEVEQSEETPIENAEEGNDLSATEILAVADMSDSTREYFGLQSETCDRKRYYVRYRYGFEAKLRLSDQIIKDRYKALIDEISLYKGLKISSSFKQQRIYKGRKTLGLIMFRGKTLCVAFALDPKVYEDTKYRGIDKSDKKRFESTPMLLKLSSERKLEYAKFLFVQLADLNTIVMESEPHKLPCDVSPMTVDEMFTNNLLRITILGEAPEAEPEAEPEFIFDEEEEIAAAQTEEDDDIALESPEGRVVYNRSFNARIIQADDALKARYSELKNYIMSYKGVKDRMSWKREAFRLGKVTVAAFTIRGKTLCLYLAADPTRFDGTKYKVENLSEQASRKATPLLFKVRSDRRTEYAKQLIDMVLTEREAVKYERKPVDYTVPYRSTENLIKRGMIKVSQTFYAPPARENEEGQN